MPLLALSSEGSLVTYLSQFHRLYNEHKQCLTCKVDVRNQVSAFSVKFPACNRSLVSAAVPGHQMHQPQSQKELASQLPHISLESLQLPCAASSGRKLSCLTDHGSLALQSRPAIVSSSLCLGQSAQWGHTSLLIP